MNKLLTLGLVFAFACGSSTEDIHLASNEQGFSVKPGPSLQLGVRTSTSRVACDRTTTGQVCSIPASDGFVFYCISDSFPAAWKTRIRTVITTYDDALSNFTFSEIDPSATCVSTPGDLEANLVFNTGTCSGGTSSSNITAYSCGTLVSANSNLTEGVGVAGSYQSHFKHLATLDLSDIIAKGSSPAQDNNIFNHAAQRAVLTYLGLGIRNAPGFASHSSIGIVLGMQPITGGEQCKLLSYSDANTTQFNLLSPQCASD